MCNALIWQRYMPYVDATTLSNILYMTLYYKISFCKKIKIAFVPESNKTVKEDIHINCKKHLNVCTSYTCTKCMYISNIYKWPITWKFFVMHLEPII